MIYNKYLAHTAALQKDVLFNLSLSSNELFHSNLLAMLAESWSPINGHKNISKQQFSWPSDKQPLDHRIAFHKVMECLGLVKSQPHPFPTALLPEHKNGEATIDKEHTAEGHYFYLVCREWHRMDLAFLRYSAKVVGSNGEFVLMEPTLLGVAEIKVKALPDANQLHRYDTVIDDKKKNGNQTGRVPRAIVYLVPPLTPLSASQPWTQVDFGGLSGSLRYLAGCIAPWHQQVLSEYIQLVQKLAALFSDVRNDLAPSNTLDDLSKINIDLSRCRLGQTFHKMAYGGLGQLISGEVKRRLFSRGWVPDQTTPVTKAGSRFQSNANGGRKLNTHEYVDLSNSTGMYGFAWEEIVKGEVLRVGVQIQDRDLKCYVSLTDGLKRLGSTPPVKTIETELIWGHIAPQYSHANHGSGVGPIPSDYGAKSLIAINGLPIGPSCSTALEFLHNHPQFNFLTFKTGSPSNVKGYVRPLFHGYSSRNDDFCDLRFDIHRDMSFQKLACLAADYLEWLLFANATPCQLPLSANGNHSVSGKNNPVGNCQDEGNTAEITGGVFEKIRRRVEQVLSE